MASIRLSLTIAALLQFPVFTADIKRRFFTKWIYYARSFCAAFTQWHSTPTFTRGHIRNLSKISYRIVEAGRQWMLAVKEWLLNETGSSRASTASHIYLQRNVEGAIVLLICILSDDFLVTVKYKYC